MSHVVKFKYIYYTVLHAVLELEGIWFKNKKSELLI
jgi:hypothetical protein